MPSSLLLAVSLAAAQAASSPAPLVVPAASADVIHVGTAISLQTRTELTTEGKSLQVGQPVELEVLMPVMVNGKVAIPAGTPAMGEITSVRNKGMWGKSGGFTGRILYLQAGSRQIRLNGSFTDRGETGTAGVVASVALLPVAGFFVTGTSARLVTGTRVTGFLGEEVPIVFAPGAAAPAPLVVLVPSPAVVPAEPGAVRAK